MKWHQNLYEAIREAIDRTLTKGEATDTVLQELFRNNPRWGKRDRNFIKEKTFRIIRRKNLWEKVAQELYGHHDAESMLKAYILVTEDVPPGFVEPHTGLKRTSKEIYRKLEQIPEFHFGLPTWLYKKGKSTWKHRWDDIAGRLNRESLPVIRVNTLKTGRKQLAEAFRNKGLQFRMPAGFPEAIVFEKTYRLNNTVWYKNGLFEWQDLSSQSVGHFAGVRPGMTVIDACAGAGGKTLHLAALMQNQGTIIALDIAPVKLRELKKRARRAGVKNIGKIAPADEKTIGRLENLADIVLVDAPCSGSGTYQRKPHLKWKFSPRAFEQILQKQRHILDTYARTVKPGGYLVYATCSVLADENQNQVQDFLNRNKDFTFVQDKTLIPDKGFDGFYMAKLKRK